MKILIAVVLTALVSSAGASAVTQAFITSRDIKDGTIQLRDLSPSARLALRGQRGAEGQAGMAGSPGERGPQGFQGPQGPQGLPGSSASTSGLSSDLTKLCNATREIQEKLGGSYVYRFFFCSYY